MRARSRKRERGEYLRLYGLSPRTYDAAGSTRLRAQSDTFPTCCMCNSCTGRCATVFPRAIGRAISTSGRCRQHRPDFKRDKEREREQEEKSWRRETALIIDAHRFFICVSRQTATTDCFRDSALSSEVTEMRSPIAELI